MNRMEEEAARAGRRRCGRRAPRRELLRVGQRLGRVHRLRHRGQGRGRDSYRNALGKPFTSDLSGQDFWTLMQTGHVPQGLVMGTCVYHIAHRKLTQALGSIGQNVELPNFTQALYEARELAMTRMQDEAGRLNASGIVGVRLEEKSHQWGSHTIEFLALGTAVTKTQRRGHAAQADHHHLARQLMTDGTTAAPRRPARGGRPAVRVDRLLLRPHRARLRRLPRPRTRAGRPWSRASASCSGAGTGGIGLHARHVALRRRPRRSRRRTPRPTAARTASCPPSTAPGARTSSSPGWRTPGRRATAAPTSACSRRRRTHGAHGVIGVVDRVSEHRRHGDDRVPLPRHRRHGRRRATPGGRGALDHLSGRAAADQVHRGRVHARRRGGGAGLGAGLGLLHDRVPHGGKHELGLADGAASRRAGDQGPHGRAPARTQARPPAAGGRRAARGHHRRGGPGALPGRRGHRLHAAGKPGAAFQGLRPVAPPRPTVRLA